MLNTRARRSLLCGAVSAAALLVAGAANAQQADFRISPQPLSTALTSFSEQSQAPIIFSPELTASKTSQGVEGASDVQLALNELLAGTGLTWRRDGNAYVIVRADDPQSESAAGGGAEVETLVVTAQKREENIQDVPIAISAFSQTALEEQKIEGGFDLLKAIPNVTFSKNNFTGYNFSIRGIGTKAISVTTDPGVAVAFNSTGLIRNRLFEQEYFDVERVEVLRGPQGTLYGRNATAGVINVISAKPDMDEFDGWLKGEVGNYHAKRLSAMVNVPILKDVVAVRLAGALTSRDGYDFNETTGNPVNGRDLWSARLTVGYHPTDRFRANFIWERFEEDDDRSRTGKQLCKRDPGRTEIAGWDIDYIFSQAVFSQGCSPVNLYADEAFQTPNGLSIPFMFLGGLQAIGTKGDRNDPAWGECLSSIIFAGDVRGSCAVPLIIPEDPYRGKLQSRDMRTINSIKDPLYRAKADVFELNIDFDITDTLSLVSQTAYNKDTIYSFQDYNRFNTYPVFGNSSEALWGPEGQEEIPLKDLTPGGVYCDPQLGCSDTIAGFDISQAESTQFSQELRIQSNFEGPWNFSAGANYTKYETLEDYYVMFNMITFIAQSYGQLVQLFNFSSDVTKCRVGGQLYDLGTPQAAGCIYIDPNPFESMDGEGHNYFRSKNPYELTSMSAFGELYWELRPDLKLTAGLRYTDDTKVFTPVPTQVLLSSKFFLAGTVDKGYPAKPDIEQHWGEFSGRLGVDWKPDLPFTEQTMVYAFYSRGYKGGGANPPGIGFAPPACDGCLAWAQTLPYPETFDPEFVNSFEIGAKNTLMDGALIINATAFYYDYANYQVSQIKDRTAVNENFDATVWGIEWESVISPTRALRFNFNVGFQDTEIADGELSLDLMDRTAGNPDYVVVKPFVLLASNCVAPVAKVDQYFTEVGGTGAAAGICPGVALAWPMDRSDYPNGGAGFFKDLGGNELPNAPHWTVSLGAQYGFDFLDTWRATVRTDTYWQSQSWHRVYNFDPYDKLHGWYNVNLSLWLERDDGLKVELYAKNLLNKTPITDAFLNSDDTALTTNVFVLDPRLVGLSIRKEF